MDTNRLLYRLAFSMVKGIGPENARFVLSRTGDEETFFRLPDLQLAELFGMSRNRLSRRTLDSVLESAKKELDYILGNNINCYYHTDPEYPSRLANCPDAPLMLFGVGKCNFNTDHVVSIVGTRHATAYGVGFTNELIHEIATRLENTLIISGLAYGIDIAAHRAALKEKVPTAAIVAHGLNTIYPAVHRNEAAAMVRSGGAVLTEYLHNTEIHRGNFLARNRIVAGMADCVIVVESADKGGSLVTARIATDYSRDVFALPGRIKDPYSAGCNKLIASNTAALIQSPEDLFHAMRWEYKLDEGAQQTLAMDLSPEELLIIDYLKQHGDARTNEMATGTGIPIGKLMSHLVELEFNGLIMSCPGSLYRLSF